LEKITCRIKEHSWLARRAARKMNSPRLAMVVGRTIYLHGVNRQTFLADIGWLRHEVCHVRQYRAYGLWRFLWLYLLECWRHGYYRNRFEVAAREAEADTDMLKGVEIV
jgi:hypothetical protein